MLNTDGAIQAIQNILSEKLNEAAQLITFNAKQRCPVRTGNLRRSIHYKPANPDNLEITIKADADYAAYVELGTYKMAAQPFLEPSVMEIIPQIISKFEDAI